MFAKEVSPASGEDIQHGGEAGAGQALPPQVYLSSGGEDGERGGNIKRGGAAAHLAGLKRIHSLIFILCFLLNYVN